MQNEFSPRLHLANPSELTRNGEAGQSTQGKLHFKPKFNEGMSKPKCGFSGSPSIFCCDPADNCFDTNECARHLSEVMGISRTQLLNVIKQLKKDIQSNIDTLVVSVPIELTRRRFHSTSNRIPKPTTSTTARQTSRINRSP